VIDDHLAASCKFVEYIRYFQEHGVLPGETLYERNIPDGKIRLAGRHASSAALFTSITTLKTKKVKSPVWKGGKA
jgi:hypothetical protein